MRLAKRFFQMIDLKYEKRSTALNINIGFCSGDDVFYDQVIAKYNFRLYFTPCTCGKHHRKSLPVKGIHDARRWVSKFVHFDVDIYIQLLILFFFNSDRKPQSKNKAYSRKIGGQNRFPLVKRNPLGQKTVQSFPVAAFQSPGRI